MDKCEECKYKQIKSEKQICYYNSDENCCYKQCSSIACDHLNDFIKVKYKRRDRGNFHDRKCIIAHNNYFLQLKKQKEIKDGLRGPNYEKYHIKCKNTINGDHYFWTDNLSIKYCSPKCASNDEDVKQKRKKTNLKKYGVESPLSSDAIKDKIKKTNLEKYGVDYGLSNPNIREKIKKTNLEKYGVINPLQNKNIREKQKQTVLNKYGVENISQSPLIKRKKEETSLINFNTKYHSLLTPQKEIIKKTMIEKYGIENICQKNILNYTNYNKEYIEKNFVENGYFLFHKCKEYFGIKQDTTIHRMKKRFNIIFPNKKTRSIVEKEIADFIKTFYTDEIKLNDFETLSSQYIGRRNPLELDIYLPKSKLAIEFNGLIYHSYGKSDYKIFNNWDKLEEHKHLSKTLNCEAKGIQLLHIFENEWEDKQEIWKSMIKIKLGYAERKINARNCEIKNTETQELKSFLDTNHIQGYINSSINLGLYLKDELVQVMTFSKPRFNKKYDWELIRECSLLNTVVRGGYSKLLKYFKENYDGNIISYANRRWSSPLNNSHGIFKKITEPNYFYFLPNENILYSRTYKIKLKKEDPLLTVRENIINEGYRIIFDCGNLIYEL